MAICPTCRFCTANAARHPFITDGHSAKDVVKNQSSQLLLAGADHPKIGMTAVVKPADGLCAEQGHFNNMGNHHES